MGGDGAFVYGGTHCACSFSRGRARFLDWSGWIGLVGACEVTRPRPAAEPPASEREVGCQPVATAALSISRATVSGCEISPRCEALILTTVAWARAAMKTCSAGGRTMSWVPINANDRMVFHAGGPGGSSART